ncbi:MAG: hypothetical protein E7612_04845 [Ruminococcaceae bacterium]|nr:hypothetical protein [Oscillospiraceae bacterium]
MNKRLLAVDIGGSKTRIRVLDTNANTLSEYCGIGVSSAIDGNSTLPPLERLISTVQEKETVGAIAINLGGLNTTQVLNTFRIFFPDLPIKIFRESEGTAAYALADEYGAKIVLMAGTGAIAVGKSNGKFVTTGGWGMNVGDDGSGYDIGLQAIRTTLSKLDGIEPLSPLEKFISGYDTPFMATDNPSAYREQRDKVIEKLYPLERQRIASLAKNVLDFAEKGDESALAIFKRVGVKMAELVVATAEKLGEEFPVIIVTGGLINSRKFWAPIFEDALKNYTVHYVADGLLLGTSYIAKKLYETGEI